MPKQALKQRLNQLQNELNETSELDEADRVSLLAIMQQIGDRIEGVSAVQSDEYLIQGLSQATEQFKTKHPTLTMIIGRVSQALSNLGI